MRGLVDTWERLEPLAHPRLSGHALIYPSVSFHENALCYVEPYCKILHDDLWDAICTPVGDADKRMPSDVALLPYGQMASDAASTVFMTLNICPMVLAGGVAWPYCRDLGF